MASTQRDRPCSPPRVSVGLPVYNGKRYLDRAVESLLNQTYRDFELIITDNCSTDATETICRRYADADSRVRYFRADKNEGIVRNFNWCFELASGEYFKWSAADDLYAPTFLERCVAVLDSDPTCVLVFSRRQIIDEMDHPIRMMDVDADADDARAHVRFGRLINVDHRRHAAQEIYGLIRRDALLRTPRYERCVRTDSILLARLALLGRFRRVDEALFLNREHANRSVQLVPGTRTRPRSRLSRWIGTGPIPPAEFWDPAAAGRTGFPEWRILNEYWRSLRLVPLSDAERARCGLVLARFTLGHTPKLARDALIAAEHALLGVPG